MPFTLNHTHEATKSFDMPCSHDHDLSDVDDTESLGVAVNDIDIPTFALGTGHGQPRIHLPVNSLVILHPRSST